MFKNNSTLFTVLILLCILYLIHWQSAESFENSSELNKDESYYINKFGKYNIDQLPIILSDILELYVVYTSENPSKILDFEHKSGSYKTLNADSKTFQMGNKKMHYQSLHLANSKPFSGKLQIS